MKGHFKPCYLFLIILLLCFITSCNVQDITTKNDETTTSPIEQTTSENDNPSGLTYADSFSRIIAYITQLNGKLDDVLTAYEEKGNESIGTAPDTAMSSIFVTLDSFDYTNIFGTNHFSLDALKTALTDAVNITFEVDNGTYILQYDMESVHYGVEIRYNSDTDSVQVRLFSDYGLASQTVQHYFEYVKKDSFYAFQYPLGRGMLEISNNQMTSFVLITYKEYCEQTTIYNRPDIIDQHYTAVDVGTNFSSLMSLNQNIYMLIEVEYYIDNNTQTITQYRLNVHRINDDGTLISNTPGNWMPIE